MMNRATVELSGRLNPGVTGTYFNLSKTKVLNRFELYVDSKDKSVGPHLIKDGFWEAWITTWVINNVGKGDIFYDVGANTGYYGFLAATLGARAIMFEPNPDYFDMISLSAKLPILRDLPITIHKLALGDRPGEKMLHIPMELHGSASLIKIPDVECIGWNVAVSRLDGLYNAQQPVKHVVKIDAEGYEEKIWDGMKGFVNSPQEVVILLEYTPLAYSVNFLRKLREWGTLSWVNHDGNEEPVDDNWVSSQIDWQMLVLRKHK